MIYNSPIKKAHLIFTVFTLLLFAVSGNAQQMTYEKLADNTIQYVKASTFGKPNVIKKTNKLALAQVRVHFKFITTEGNYENKKNTAKVSVYLDGKMTDQDLQNLTDEFYRILERKFAAAGIGSVDWQAIKATEYYANRVEANENRKLDGDVKSGQAWASFTAFDGHVFYRFNILDPLKSELLAFGKQKKISKMSEEVDAEIGFFDAMVDFTDINLQTDIKTVYEDKQKKTVANASQNITAILNVPVSNALLLDRKNNFDFYRSDLPVSVNQGYSGKLYENANLASLGIKRFFQPNERFTFNPVVVPANREEYIAVAKKVLDAYADLFVEKMRQIRGDEKKNVAKEFAPKDEINKIETQSVGDFKTKGMLFEKNRDFQSAINVYTEAIKAFPNEANFYLKRAAMYDAAGKYKEAEDDSTMFIKLEPKNPTGYYNRGTAYIRRKKDKEALKDLEMAVKYADGKINPKFMASILTNRGIAYILNNKIDQAEKDFNEAIRIAPTSPDGYRGRAIFYKVKGSTQLAQADELKAVQLSRGQ